MNYFTNLEFFWDQIKLGPSVQRKRLIWTIAVYILFALGLFSRQITNFPHVTINFANIKWDVLAASFIIGLALFPPLIRWLNKNRSKPSLEHIISAFSYGFFVDLTNQEIIVRLLKKMGFVS